MVPKSSPLHRRAVGLKCLCTMAEQLRFALVCSDATLKPKLSCSVYRAEVFSLYLPNKLQSFSNFLHDDSSLSCRYQSAERFVTNAADESFQPFLKQSIFHQPLSSLCCFDDQPDVVSVFLCSPPSRFFFGLLLYFLFPMTPRCQFIPVSQVSHCTLVLILCPCDSACVR